MQHTIIVTIPTIILAIHLYPFKRYIIPKINDAKGIGIIKKNSHKYLDGLKLSISLEKVPIIAITTIVKTTDKIDSTTNVDNNLFVLSLIFTSLLFITSFFDVLK